jgi:methionine synthase I (cobalamin-dependent)
LVVASLGPRVVWKDEDFRQLDTAIEHGADALALETCQPEQALASLEAIRERTTLSILVSIFARPARDFWKRAQDGGADAVGVNCIADFHLIRQILEDASEAVALPLLVKPSAGLPGEKPATPADFANELNAWIDRGARVIGGCCGTTDRHIAALRTALDAKSPGFRPDKTREIGL